MKQAFYLLLAAILTACRGGVGSQREKTNGSATVVEAPKSSDRLLVKEAVLRDLGLTPRSTLRETNITVFLIVPKEEQEYFINRYPALKVQVEGSDNATQVGGAVVDSLSGNQAIIYNVSVIELDASKAKALGGFFYGRLAGTSYLYDLHFERGRWRIVQKEESVTF